ncbi:MAG: DNA mismatch repair protein MutS, partial [Clostridia bacterium]|nr:DNA mismatch repair protein MutS [Clostridia bacterium]
YCLFYLLFYIKETQKCNIKYLDHIEVYSNTQYMQLDITARRNLELVEGMRTGDHKGSLFSVLNKTKSALGKRMLISFLERPLLSVVEINRRLDAVENLNFEPILRSQIRDQLYKIYDLERLITRVMYRRANPRDLLALKQTFETLPYIRNAVSTFPSQKLKSIYNNIDELQDLYDLIERAINNEASTVMRDGGYIKEGYNEKLDEYALLLSDTASVINQMQEKERERTGIKNLKISYNRVFGYYIEVTRAYFDKIPEDYIRKQTLTDKERMITPELKDLEYKILSAKDKKVLLEQELFDELLDTIAASYYRIRTTASALAELDVFCSFSQIATDQNYVKPDLTEGDELQIVEGRHPVVECNLKDTLFVPNDIDLNASDRRIMVITGPNMGGKSTYMRQVAIITIMAQIGCFVPAKSARIGVVDKIFTRVGASDDLSLGDSTFMVEMKEVAYILNNATPKSLLILDEIGRGTSTLDGMSIAQAVVEYLAQKKNLRAKTLFATHYHELCALESTLDGLINYNVTVKKRGEQVVFLKKIVPGGADNSYGIEVAALAGIPKPVVTRAREILDTLSVEQPKREYTTKTEELTDQVSFMDFSAQQICDELKMLDVSTLTPIEAISKLYELSNKAKQNN